MCGHEVANLPANEALLALNMLCEEDAAIFMDSSIIVAEAVAKAMTNTATAADLAAAEQALIIRFPAKLVDDTSAIEPHVELRDLKQKPDESLNMYYQRAANILTRLDCRDTPRTALAVCKVNCAR